MATNAVMGLPIQVEPRAKPPQAPHWSLSWPFGMPALANPKRFCRACDPNRHRASGAGTAGHCTRFFCKHPGSCKSPAGFLQKVRHSSVKQELSIFMILFIGFHDLGYAFGMDFGGHFGLEASLEPGGTQKLWTGNKNRF